MNTANTANNLNTAAIYGLGDWTPERLAEGYGLSWAELTAWALAGLTARALADSLACGEYVAEALEGAPDDWDNADRRREARCAARDWADLTRYAVAEAWGGYTPAAQAREAVKLARTVAPGWGDFADADGFGLSRLEALARSMARSEAGTPAVAAVLE